MAPSSAFLIPPRRVRLSGGRPFAWPAAGTLSSMRLEDRDALSAFARDLETFAGARVRVAPGWSPDAPLRVVRDSAMTAPESYRLEVAPRGVTLSAGDDAGAFHGVQTLRELARLHGRSWPAMTIEDAPDLARRGLSLDCSRGKVPTPATLKALVDRMAAWKMNELQLYIENVFAWRRHPSIGADTDRFTPGDLLDLQDYAAARHVRLVPCLASFGHMETILALPAYRPLSEMPGGWTRPGGTTLCPGDPRSIRLVAELYEEFVPLFRAADFNVCGDEPWELGRGRSRARAKRVGVGRVYLDFLLKLHALCERHGKRMNAWADIALQHPDILGGLPRDVVLLNWDYYAQGFRIARTREIVDAGLACVACPGTSGWKTHGTRLENAVGNVARFSAEARRLGLEGLLQTDWGDFGHRNTLGASLHGIAHAAAHAWNGAAVDDEAFTDIFCRHVFGARDGRLARAIRTLGGTASAGTGSDGREALTYHMLVEPCDPSAPDFHESLDPASPVCWPARYRYGAIDLAGERPLRDIVESLSDRALWSGLPASPDDFEKLALREYRLAASMDLLAAERALAVRARRAGRNVPARAWRGLRDRFDRLGADFEALWLARNHPSRLADNLRLFKLTAREAARQG